MDVVFVSVSGDFSLEWCDKMVEGPDGCVVIDNSSAFRMKEEYALCVPEINADAAKKSSKKPKTSVGNAAQCRLCWYVIEWRTHAARGTADSLALLWKPPMPSSFTHRWMP